LIINCVTYYSNYRINESYNFDCWEISGNIVDGKEISKVYIGLHRAGKPEGYHLTEATYSSKIIGLHVSNHSEADAASKPFYSDSSQVCFIVNNNYLKADSVKLAIDVRFTNKLNKTEQYKTYDFTVVHR
jgi:hypothetical protein